MRGGFWEACTLVSAGKPKMLRYREGPNFFLQLEAVVEWLRFLAIVMHFGGSRLGLVS
jgi:hypothetical protein